MKKWLAALFLLLLLSFAARSETESARLSVPAQIADTLAAFHPEYQLEDYVELPDSPMGRVGFTLIRCSHGRMLHGFCETDGEWRNWLANTKAIPQGAHANAQLYIYRENPGYSELWYSEHEHPFTAPQGPLLSVCMDNGEYVEARADYLIGPDGLTLFSYGDHPNCQIDVVEDSLVFYNISYGYEGMALYSFPLDILQVDFGALPRNVQDIRITGSGEPRLPTPDSWNPLVEWNNYLKKQPAALRTGKYPVYMGPGYAYGRAADGKAVVSTNDWVQIFGRYDGWLLIHYAVSDLQYRFGWIREAALEKGQSVPALPLSFGDWVSNEEPVSLTDDPLNSRRPLLLLPRWTSMERLAQLGDGYSLVRLTLDGTVYWGFVFSWPLGHG